MSIPQGIRTYLDRQGTTNARVIPLTGDASDRRYFRIVPPDGARSFVLALHTAPFEMSTLPFANVAELFARMELPVPRIVGHAADVGVLALDDLGDVTLQAHLGACAPADWVAWYRQAVDYIVQIQQRGHEEADPRFLPYGIAFDVEKLTWEMDFFRKHFLGAYRGITPTAAENQALTEELGALVHELAAEPRVLCHRDYHSRNLMVHDGRLFVIDFQDARMGPDTYDLVSLLRDSYVDLPDALVTDALDRFAAAAGHRDRAEFERRFDLMALQRNLKALGTFGFQTVSRGNPVYAQYVPRTLRYVRENLQRQARFERFGEMLGRWLGA